MTIENEPSDEELDAISAPAYANQFREDYESTNEANLLLWRAGHARGVADERAKSTTIITTLAEQVDALKAELEHWVVSGQSAELSILRAEKARREGEHGPRSTGEELCDQYELIHPGVRAGGFAEYCFLAGAAWAESGRPEQPPRGPRPPNPWHRNDPEHRGWNECAAAYEAWLASGREGPSEEGVAGAERWAKIIHAAGYLPGSWNDLPNDQRIQFLRYGCAVLAELAKPTAPASAT